MKIRRGKDIKLRWSVTVNDRPITADDDLTLVLINPRLEKIKLDYFIEDGALVFYFRGKEQKFLGEYKLTLWLNYGKENQTALDDTSCFTLVRFTDDEDNDLEDITEVELKGTVTISGDSAYEIWLKNGNTGTQFDFLESLQGKDGIDGLDANSAIEVVNQETNSAAQKGTINVKSTGINSIAGGIKSYATGNYSLAFGRHNIAEGRGSIAIGGTVSNKKFTGKGGATIYTTDMDYNYLDVVNSGLYVWDSLEGDDKEPAKTVSAIVDEETDTLIVTLDRTLSDTDITNKAYAVTFNHATGNSAIAMGGKAVGNSATCLGTFNYAKGTCTTAIGNGNSIDGQSGLVLGADNKAKGNYTYSIGRGNYNGSPFNFTVGYKNTAIGDYSMAFGNWGNARDKGVQFAYGVSSFYVSPTDTPCKYILHNSANINHNKFISSLKNSYFIKPKTPNQMSTDDKCITITNAEFIDGTYYIYTEKEVKGITDRTNVGIIFPSIGAGSLVFGKGAAVKPYSVVFGQYNIANATPSFTAGYKNVVEGDSSIGLGMFLNTKNEGEVAVGRHNKSNTGADLSTTTLFSIGNGDRDGDKLDEYGWIDMGNGSNALEVMRNGDIYLGGYGDGYKLYDGVNKKVNITPTTITNGTGTNSSLQVNAINCKATGVNSFAGGINAEANGDYSMAYGRFAQANGRGSIALGGLTYGMNFTGAAGTTTYTTNNYEWEIPYIVGVKVYKTTTDIEEPATITNAVWENDKAVITLDKSLNPDADVNGVKWYLGYNHVNGISSVSLGGNLVLGNNSAAACSRNIVKGGQSFAAGYGNVTVPNYSYAFGDRNKILGGTMCSAFGQLNTIDNGAVNSGAFGYLNKVRGSNSFAFGNYNEIHNNRSAAFGQQNYVYGDKAFAFGAYTQALGQGSFSQGAYLFNYYLSATDTECKYLVESNDNIKCNNQLDILPKTKFGNSVNTPMATCTNAEFVDGKYYIYTDIPITPLPTTNTKIYGIVTKAVGECSMATFSNTALGTASKAFGYDCIAKGDASMTNGEDCITNGKGSTAMGLFLETNNEGEAAFGQKNKSNTGSTSAEQTLFSVGNGDITEVDNNGWKTVGNGTNTLEIMRNGDVWIGNYNEGKKLWDVATGTSPLVEEIVNKILTEKGVING